MARGIMGADGACYGQKYQKVTKRALKTVFFPNLLGKKKKSPSLCYKIG
ncbi:MAG: hypothetical protein BWY72_02313 [Bacteroidetes bacterium ADurb.Bin416]|nr:MAG: hypothetical protein BWY72_02313 [Bacteroidetes bacterium ADurb.Bin416]